MKIKFIKIDEKEVGKNIANYKAFFGTPPKYIVMNENTSNIIKEITKIDLFYNSPKDDISYNATFWGIPIAICNSSDLKDGEIELV
jgi:hypothetical protein